MSDCPFCGGTGELYSDLLAEDIACLACEGSGIYEGPGGEPLTTYHDDTETCDRPDCLHCRIRER